VDTLVTRRAAGREAPDGVHIRDGKWLVPVVRGIAFKDPTEAMSYLLADNQIQTLAGYDWHEMNEIAKIVAESPEGLVGTGFVSMAEIEAQMEREVQGVLNQGGDDGSERLPDNDEGANEGIDGKSDVMFKFGQHHFTVPRDRWIKWLDDVRLSGGFDKESIVNTVREKLGL
jgi:hypothetical protein